MCFVMCNLSPDRTLQCSHDLRLLPSVHLHVARQVTLVVGAKLTLLASKGLLPGVHPLVCREVALPRGLELTLVARKPE